jgi:hypothetical protein
MDIEGAEMAKALYDGKHIETVVFDGLDISPYPNPESGFIEVPHLYTGRLKFILIARTEVKIPGRYYDVYPSGKYTFWSSATLTYFNKNKQSLKVLNYIKNYPIGTYPAGKIITEFNLPIKYSELRDLTNKAYYVKIKLVHQSTGNLRSGLVDGYIIYE